jgi:hypothetical protein
MIRSMRGAEMITLLLALVACSFTPVPEVTLPLAASRAKPIELFVLAGEWEYEDSGIVQILRLDEQGNGAYGWKDGRFQTGRLAGQTWSGYWSQRENDREGRFEVTLSEDFLEGRGQWWYTRIENETSPHRPGGSFILRRAVADTDRNPTSAH